MAISTDSVGELLSEDLQRRAIESLSRSLNLSQSSHGMTLYDAEPGADSVRVIVQRGDRAYRVDALVSVGVHVEDISDQWFDQEGEGEA